MAKSKSKVKNELEGIKKEDMKLVEPKKEKVKKHIYFGYYQRLIFLIILFVLFIIFSLLLFNKSLIIQEKKNIAYQESGTLDYKVYLKDNIYYEEKYLGKEMSYIANLIDYISIDYKYLFSSDTMLKGEYYYNIVADLEILNPDNKSLFYSKKYNLLNEKKFDLDNDKNYIINENVIIDYSYYNALANSFKASYGINAESNLKVYLELHRRINEESVNNNAINSDGKISLTIPLSEKAINIKMDELDIKNNNIILSLNNYKIKDYQYLVLAIVSLVFAIIVFVKITKNIWIIKGTTNDYDKMLNKIMKQYDRLIVNTNTMPDLVNNNVTEVKDFLELLDAKDNLHKPIFYYEVAAHQKCYFFIKDNDNIIIFTLKNN